MYPDIKKPQIAFNRRKPVWNDLRKDTYVVVTRVIQDIKYHFFGQVDWVEKLRNCHMLHFYVWECWRDGADGRELTQSRIDSLTNSYVLPAEVRWKKTKGSDLRRWDPTVKMAGYTLPNPGRYGNKMPSYQTLERLNLIAPEVDELDELLNKKAQQRAAYAAHRGRLQEARTELGRALAYLELSDEPTAIEFKRARQKVMLKWHPDMAVHFSGTSEDFNQGMIIAVAAISFVEQKMFPRDVLHR